MKIQSITLVRVNRPPRPEPQTQPSRQPWTATDEVANPMSRFPRFKRHRSLYGARQWPGFAVKVTAEDGTWGLGSGAGRPAAAVIQDAFAHILEGEECSSIERLWDMMFRVSKPFGTVGIATVAISAVDLALWDLAGKLAGKPVYELIGGPARERIFAYATGNDVDWYRQCGFRAFKLACPYGPADGLEGLRRNEELVARTREMIGDECELMLDCYMAFDVEYTVRLAERLRPYRLKWIEEYLIPEDIEGHIEVRRRLPWMTLASGEHIYTRYPYQQMIKHGCLDVLQPDIHWVGGLSECLRICHMAAAADLMVCLHGGALNPYGLHLTWAMPNTPWGEYFVGSPPGVPLAEAAGPDALVPRDSYLEFRPSAPGFGLGVEEQWLEPFTL
ncbi:MAG: enolase C-terminal domain-like protein [Candidatus Latescibacterota bacterium]